MCHLIFSWCRRSIVLWFWHVLRHNHLYLVIWCLLWWHRWVVLWLWHVLRHSFLGDVVGLFFVFDIQMTNDLFSTNTFTINGYKDWYQQTKKNKKTVSIHVGVIAVLTQFFVLSMNSVLFLLIIYWRTLKTQHLNNSFNNCLEKEGRTIILIVC